jgi:hypothetical protein
VVAAETLTCSFVCKLIFVLTRSTWEIDYHPFYSSRSSEVDTWQYKIDFLRYTFRPSGGESNIRLHLLSVFVNTNKNTPDHPRHSLWTQYFQHNHMLDQRGVIDRWSSSPNTLTLEQGIAYYFLDGREPRPCRYLVFSSRNYLPKHVVGHVWCYWRPVRGQTKG